jgi:hypothetical protein
MTQNTPLPIATQGPDVPYHYTSLRYQLRRYSPLAEPFPPKPKPDASSRLLDQRLPGLADEAPQTVEQLIAHGALYVPTSEPETALLTDRKQTAWLGLEDAIYQVRQRIDIYSQNMYELQLAQCAAQNDLFAFEARYGWPAPAEQHYVLGKRLQRLYSEQRAERVALWQDVSRVKQLLPESAQQYLSAVRKMQILDAPGRESE